MSSEFQPNGKTAEELCASIERRNKVNATAAKRKGRRVKSLEELEALARWKRSVYCDNCWGLLPAAVVMNMSANIVFAAIHLRGIYEYIPLKPRKEPDAH